jgi:hypothetical protein
MNDQTLLDTWERWVAADADRRGLHALKPLAAGLRASAARLREADWNANAASRDTPPGNDD